jgi:hypothetical protein
VSLDVYLGRKHWQNITHNLAPMWHAAGCYDALYESDGKRAQSIVKRLRAALVRMETDPDAFKRHDAPNGWGLYENAVPWLRRLLAACEEHPNATIRVSK